MIRLIWLNDSLFQVRAQIFICCTVEKVVLLSIAIFLYKSNSKTLTILCRFIESKRIEGRRIFKIKSPLASEETKERWNTTYRIGYSKNTLREENKLRIQVHTSLKCRNFKLKKSKVGKTVEQGRLSDPICGPIKRIGH